MCVVKKHGCFRSHRLNSTTKMTKYLGFAISILLKIPTKSGEPCVECNGHALIPNSFAACNNFMVATVSLSKCTIMRPNEHVVLVPPDPGAIPLQPAES